MLNFLLAASALVLLAGAFLVWPLLRRPRLAKSDGDAANLAVYRDQKAEIEAELARGQLGEAERAAAMEDLTARLAEELATRAPPAEAAQTARRPWLALALGLALPLLAAAVYLKVGAPAALEGVVHEQRAPSREEMVAMVDRLAAKMTENPGDLGGWLLLARSHGALGRHAEAAAAYAKADGLAPKDPEILTHWANAEAMVAQGDLAGKPYALALQALAAEPQYLPALAMAAAHELRSGQFPAAKTHLAAILAQLPADAEERPRVEALLAEIGAAAPSKARQ